MAGRRVKGRTSPQIMHVSLSDRCTKLWHYTKHSTYPLTSPPPHLTGLLVVSSTVILHASPTDTGWAVYTTPLLLNFTLLATEHPSENFTCSMLRITKWCWSRRQVSETKRDRVLRGHYASRMHSTVRDERLPELVEPRRSHAAT